MRAPPRVRGRGGASKRPVNHRPADDRHRIGGTRASGVRASGPDGHPSESHFVRTNNGTIYVLLFPPRQLSRPTENDGKQRKTTGNDGQRRKTGKIKSRLKKKPDPTQLSECGSVPGNERVDRRFTRGKSLYRCPVNTGDRPGPSTFFSWDPSDCKALRVGRSDKLETNYGDTRARIK